MKSTTKAASRVKRLKRQARRRHILISIGTTMVLAALSVPVFHLLKNNIAPPTSPYTPHFAMSHSNPSQQTLRFLLSSGSQATASSGSTLNATTSTPTQTSSTATESKITGTPATAGPLSISPSAITVYVNSSNAPGVRAGALTTNINVSAANGDLIEAPFITGGQGLALSGTTNTTVTKATWTIGVSGTTGPGTYNLELQASSTNGHVYAGGITVNVVQLPTFTVNQSSDVIAQIDRGSTETASFTGLGYTAASGTQAPLLTVSTLQGATVTCSSGLSFTASVINCTDPAISTLPDGSTIMEFTFQNQYQVVSIAGSLIVTN